VEGKNVGHERVDRMYRLSNYERVITTIYYNDAQSESPYKRGVNREDDRITTGVMYLPRAIPNGLQGQVLGY
jgi:hypothetical protein